MPNYNYSQLKSDINAGIKGKIGILIDARSTINQGVRQVLSDLDLMTTRRRVSLTPNLFNGIFEYACPTDLKGYGIITIQNQKWTQTPDWSLVPYEQFMRRQDYNTIAISDYDFVRKLYIKSPIEDNKLTIDSLDSVGTWTVFGDAENLVADRDNYVASAGSLSFDISSAGSTTCGIEKTSVPTIDLTDYLQGNGTITVWTYINSTTNLTNYILRIGTDSSNYYSKTTTTQSDGTAFVTGWNLLRFDLNSLTEAGTVTDTTINYVAIYMTKAAGKISELGYKFDNLVLHRGEINKLYYYSGYGWQTISGTYIENCTTDSDLLNAGGEEYELIKCKCIELAADEVDEEKVSEKQQVRYNQLKKMYINSNPSESLIMISTTMDFVKL